MNGHECNSGIGANMYFCAFYIIEFDKQRIPQTYQILSILNCVGEQTIFKAPQYQYLYIKRIQMGKICLKSTNGYFKINTLLYPPLPQSAGTH